MLFFRGLSLSVFKVMLKLLKGMESGRDQVSLLLLCFLKYLTVSSHEA